jgi:hypothetical protein
VEDFGGKRFEIGKLESRSITGRLGGVNASGLDRRAILPPMSRPALLAIVLSAAAAALGCDLREPKSAALAALGWPSFREIEAPQAREAVRGGALLLQARGEDHPARRAAGARLVLPGQPLDEAARGRTIVVVAEEPELGFQLGARLARAGETRVAVVPGGLPAWETEATEE